MRVILIDPDDDRRDVLAKRLRAQGYSIEVAPSAAAGANLTLLSPPAAVIADLWMPGISGVQLCRLLGAEPSTIGLPVILRGKSDSPRNRFWAERAGAAAYVSKGRMGELVRSLQRTIKPVDEDEMFFTQLGGSDIDIRDRIANHLDRALFESVVAAEVRALSSCGDVERLFDLFSQLLSQITQYRWLAMETKTPRRVGVHVNPAHSHRSVREAKQVLELDNDIEVMVVEDEDALPGSRGPAAITAPMLFGGMDCGRIAVAPIEGEQDVESVLRMAGQELGAPLRIAFLVEESKRLASIDSLTGLSNRRDLTAKLSEAVGKAHFDGTTLALMLLDVDRFKNINDNFGHAAGDQVLSGLGRLLNDFANGETDFAGRWGGEEFVVFLTGLSRAKVIEAAEELRRRVSEMHVAYEGQKIPVTVSIGVSLLGAGDGVDTLIDRADQAMYLSKTRGRNRVTLEDDIEQDESAHAQDESALLQ